MLNKITGYEHYNVFCTKCGEQTSHVQTNDKGILPEKELCTKCGIVQKVTYIKVQK